jgi:hypothetical protein
VIPILGGFLELDIEMAGEEREVTETKAVPGLVPGQSHW